MNVVKDNGQIPGKHVLVAAPNQAGKQFIGQLRQRGIPFYAIVNNNHGKKRLEAMGVGHIITVDTADESTWNAPELPIGSVYLFEDSFNLTCRYLQMCSAWEPESIYVVTRRDYSRLTYKALGASDLIYTTGKDISFLLGNLE